MKSILLRGCFIMILFSLVGSLSLFQVTWWYVFPGSILGNLFYGISNTWFERRKWWEVLCIAAASVTISVGLYEIPFSKMIMLFGCLALLASKRQVGARRDVYGLLDNSAAQWSYYQCKSCSNENSIVFKHPWQKKWFKCNSCDMDNLIASVENGLISIKTRYSSEEDWMQRTEALRLKPFAFLIVLLYLVAMVKRM